MEGIIAAKILKLPLVGTYHTLISEPEYLSVVRLDKFKPITSVARKYSNFFYNRCDLVITPSYFAKYYVMRHGVRKKISVVSNGIDISRFESPFDKNELKTKYGIGDFTCIYVGRVSKEKNIDVTLKAIRVVKDFYPNIRLLIAGKGPYLDELELYAEALGLAKNAIFIGEIKNEEIGGLLSASDVFVTASTSETQGISVIEAMASGLPVIGVDKRGVPELIEHNGNGFIAHAGNYHEIAQYILMLIRDRGMQTLMGMRSKQLSYNYSADKIVQDLENEYYSLILKKH
jgi:1,2-diacylglycerol 3-alpha-glucosyltransferase